jgi:malonate decarboxylase alpha subunit
MPVTRELMPEEASRNRREVRDVVPLLEAIMRPGDRVCLEGDNQKQADL